MRKNKDTTVAGIAVTKRGRERVAKQATARTTGDNPTDLEYVEDRQTRTGKVVDKDTGETRGRFSW